MCLKKEGNDDAFYTLLNKLLAVTTIKLSHCSNNHIDHKTMRLLLVQCNESASTYRQEVLPISPVSHDNLVGHDNFYIPPPNSHISKPIAINRA